MAPRGVNRKRLLVVSNGYGEDVAVAQVVRALPVEDLDVIAYPLVGLGLHYPPGVRFLDPRREFPSGGFGWIAGWRSLRHDLAQGLARFWLTQRRTLRSQRGRVDLVLVAGDVYCLAMASGAGGPIVYLAWTKSHYVAPYNLVEVCMLRRLASQARAACIVQERLISAGSRITRTAEQQGQYNTGTHPAPPDTTAFHSVGPSQRGPRRTGRDRSRPDPVKRIVKIPP